MISAVRVSRWFGLLLLTLAAAAPAQDMQDLDAIRRAGETFVQAQTRNTNIGVRCLQPEPWTVHLPTTVKVFADVVVLSRPVARNHPLDAADVRLQNLDLTQQPAGIVTDPASVLGRLTSVALPAGHVLKLDQLRAPAAITYGQTVRIVFRGEGFRVSSEGRALGNAATGEQVQVRAASGKVLRATVQGPGVVEVR
jgi:flagella basal body P-ring formation protein FlgA